MGTAIRPIDTTDACALPSGRQPSSRRVGLDRMHLRLDDMLDWFAPGDCGEGHARRHVRMFVISHMFGPFLGLSAPIALLLVDPAPYPQVYILAASIAGFWPFLFLLRLFPRRYDALASLSLVNLNFAVLWASYHYGGVNSPFLLWYMLVPFLGYLYLGGRRRAQAQLFGHILAGLGIFGAAYAIGGAFPQHLAVSDMVWAGLVSVVCSTLYVFFMATYYTQVVDSQSELIKEVHRHEETAEKLVSSRDEAEHATRLAEARNVELELAKARLEHNALHDALTALPNRRYLDARLKTLAGECAADGGGVVLLHIDLDRFKQINDTLGHAAGDAMLVHVAQLLVRAVGEKDFVARVGGDEFIVICRSCPATGEVTELATRIIDEISRPVPYRNHLCRFGACVGIAMESGDAIQPERLMINADIALYRAKARGRKRTEFFSEELQTHLAHTNRVADDLLRGLERGEFVVHYQPQIDAQTFRVVGAEALVRWQHPTEGLLAPAAFLGVAEEVNLVAELDRLVLEQATADLREWREANLALDRLSVNVSAKRLNDEGLIRSLNELSFVPGTLSFELVESIFLDDTDLIIERNIKQIKQLGIEIEIDDFGTGHASIVSLLKLNPKRLKIDRQFIRPLTESQEQTKLVASIIEMGKSLGIGIVAEGVETMPQALMLQELGCDVLQGYAFARPMPANELVQFIVKPSRFRKT